MNHNVKTLGFGLGLRAKHYPYIFEHQPDIDWFEVISENFMDTDGKPKRNLARIKERYPIVMHGVSMSIGTVDPLNSEYLQKLKALIKWANPVWISDHLCWTGVAHKNMHDLLPIPYTEEALKHVVQRIREVEDYLEHKIAFENPSTYMEFKTSHIPEAEFIARMAEEADCNLLLDVNNVYVTCYNHRLDPKAYIDALPLERVVQIHISGHTNKGSHIIDTHDNHAVDEVLNLYKYVVHKAGRIPNTMIEWDDNIPDFPGLEAELARAKAASLDPADYTLPHFAKEQVPQRINHTVHLQAEQNYMQKAIMEGAEFDSKPQEWIRNKTQFPAEDQLKVYINAYRYRLNDVVAEDCPVLKYYLGEEKFKKTIWEFVNKIRPDHFNIARYIEKLPDFIKSSLPQDKFAYEISELETMIAVVADKPETEVLQQKHLASLTPEQLMDITLYPRAALSLLSFAYPINEYYRGVMEEENPSPAKPQKSYIAVFRHEDVVWRMDLEEEESLLLQKLFSGITIGEALNAMDESIAEKLTEWFSRWIRNGLLAAQTYGEYYEAA